MSLDSIKSKLANEVNWERVSGGGRVLRFSAWYTANDCSCKYKYGKLETHKNGFVANKFDSWMYDVSKRLAEFIGLKHVPNCINFNRYDNIHQSLGLHTDDERLFKDANGGAEIVSVSFGAARGFRIVPNYSTNDDGVKEMILTEGDILSMLGLTQLHFRHEVLKGDEDGVRYNITCRYLQDNMHERGCKCRLAN